MRDLKNTVEIERRCLESGEPVFITKNGYGKLVVLDINVYERTLRNIYEAKLINESLVDIKSGGTLIEGEEFKKEVMARYGR